MKKEEMIALGLAAVAVLLIFKATGKKTANSATGSGTWGGATNTPIKSPFGNPYGFTYITQKDQDEFNKLIGL